ncbi:MAG: 3-hydroxylacyl-ACP dehydratase [Elusimicrobia bacterium]|nr:3-hydroxylacyl-ACP dehydratase [Elusimicrobiota bacterium]
MALVQIDFPLPAETVVPHKGRISLLRNVLSHNENETVCDVLIHPDSLFLENGVLGAWVTLEYMAQTVAAHAGVVARKNGGHPQIGFLLGARRLELHTPFFRMGEILHVHAKHLWGEGELFSFSCTVYLGGGGGPVALAELNVYRPAHMEELLQGEK